MVILVWQASHSIPIGLWTEVASSCWSMKSGTLSPLGRVMLRSGFEWQLRQYPSVCCSCSLAWVGVNQNRLSNVMQANNRIITGSLIAGDDLIMCRSSSISIIFTILVPLGRRSGFGNHPKATKQIGYAE